MSEPGKPQWKLPLAVREIGWDTMIMDAAGETVVCDASPEDAREIARRCNAFDDLLAACEATLAHLATPTTPVSLGAIPVIDQLRAAVFLAKGE